MAQDKNVNKKDEEIQTNPVEIIKEQTDVDNSLPITPKAEAPTIIDDVSELSNGTLVRFKVLPQHIAQKALAMMLSHVKRTRDGIEVTSGKEINAVTDIIKYHDTLVLMGVELVGDVEDTISEDQREEIGIMTGNSLHSKRMLSYYYLRYFGFTSEDDFELLSTKLLS